MGPEILYKKEVHLYMDVSTKSSSFCELALYPKPYQTPFYPVPRMDSWTTIRYSSRYGKAIFKNSVLIALVIRQKVNSGSDSICTDVSV